MSSTQQPKAPSRLDRDPVCRLGNWLFVPDRRNVVGDVRDGYLSCNGERVVLRNCSRILADFVRAIRQIEEDFDRRCGTLSVLTGV